MFNFNDRVVVVTGGTRGIGRAISESFLKAGAKVVATYQGNDEKAQEMKLSLKELGENLELRKFDVRNAESVKTFYTWVEETLSKVDVLINNSGIRRDNILASLSENDWDDVLDTNLKGTYLMTQGAVLLMMKKRYGRIVNISSVGGELGLPGQANYAASKAGQVAISQSVSKEVAKRGITINNVLPGFIETELIADLPADQVEEYKKQVPMKRFGKASEVANAVMFLASEEASYITGASLTVDGGL
ncbi:MAG: beta-ketoacyl-ACP reductase [Bdellovibrio sp. CG12_big_fil_rev_8_21_14_0_65_39_13]|nr:MAG: beta-ketoacyl-ACP reductase [Bdellovibrio sp. CG22_combo_CG10-13_8_21_14_all_39_27]PIQ59618.1 MAG: beta-ketoacyl-ACP reductase [Bdellovibrio sp. CG12_big_fil_rev_8_21_14_0_65_39_13]PIR34490.1 MAG: beta-ketoacyl-ACP reductase [Bdellovibrio sp. CG11_big_fil_rev_8_21_14_0_20_39_38]